LPLGFKSAAEIAAEFDRDDEMRPLMVAARKEIADHFYTGSPSLTYLRLSRGVSQTQLASAALTSQSHIARIESGAQIPNLATVARIARALGVPIGDLAEMLAPQQED